ALLRPGEPPEAMTNLLPASSVILLAALLAAGALWVAPNWRGAIVGGALAFAFLRSPTTPVFFNAFPPSYFPAVLLVGGLLIARARNLFWLGVAIGGLGIGVMPQVLPMAIAALCGLVYVRELPELRWPKVFSRAISGSLLLATPYILYQIAGAV